MKVKFILDISLLSLYTGIMKTFVEVYGFVEKHQLGCGEQNGVVMKIYRSPFYGNKVVLKIGDAEEYFVDLDDMSNAIAMFVFEKELLSKGDYYDG